MTECVGIMEIFSWTPGLVAADVATKAGDVRIPDVEINGAGGVTIKVVGAVADVVSALDAGERVVLEMRARCQKVLMPAYPGEVRDIIHHAQEFSGIIQDIEHLLPSGTYEGDRIVGEETFAVGLVEGQGFTGVLAAADVMLKAANVEVLHKEKIGAAHVTVVIKGDVADVATAVEAGAQECERVGKLVARHVIPRPHPGILDLLK